ncbi:hypothetical protein BGX29_001054 [Mortierella sp. GBA35]|nr:hypothetical protein BGX29_001054 [Mortierella sp. GBA35]
MTHVVPTLKKDSTRNLCDQFTNIFDIEKHALEVPSVSASASIDLALSLSISLAMSASTKVEENSLDLTEVLHKGLVSAAEYPSPAPSSEESDDSLVVDSLSPPSSPWFASTTDFTVPTATTDAKEKTSNAGEEVDFFRNPFYRSLQDTDGVHPQSLFVQRKKVSLPQAVKRARDRLSYSSSTSSGQISQTAAPSDLFNVSLDQILSAEPLNLSLETQQLLLSAVEVAFQSSQEQDGSLSQESDNMMEGVRVTGTISAPEDDHGNDEEAMEGAEQDEQKGHDAEHSHESDHDDQSDPDYQEPTPAKQKKTRSSSATTKKRTPRGTGASNGKAPRARKGTYKRSLKVYPPRRPKSNIASVVDNENEDEPEVKSESKDRREKKNSSHGIVLPGGIKLPLDKDGYLCEFCPKERFGRVHDLKRHQISKHNERTWPCDFCHRPFVRRDALLRHYAVKTARNDGVHPTAEDVDRLSEARARARLI